MSAARKKSTESNSNKTKPKNFIPLGARGYVDDEPVEFLIKCHKCGSDWVIKKGSNPNNPDLQLLKCNSCGCRFDIGTWVKREVVKTQGLALALSLSDIMNYSAAHMAKRLEMHPTTYVKYEHIIAGAILEQLDPLAQYFCDTIS